MSILGRRAAMPAKGIPLVVVHEDLIEVSRRQIAASPRAETGGKFLGYVIAPGSEPPSTPYGQAVAKIWGILATEGSALLLVGSISPGPRAQSTPVEIFPDTDFQVGVLRAMESREPAIEHLGSWHSHHPNGLPRFSEGDLAHYRSVMTDPNYGPDYFVAGLCVDGRGLVSGGHLEVFGRQGVRQALTVDQVKKLKRYPSLQRDVEAAERTVASRLAGTSSAVTARAASPSDEAADQMEATLRKHFAIQRRDEDDEAISWVITDRGGAGLQGVVTWAKGNDGPVAASLEVSHTDATLRYDGSLSGDVRSLSSRLQRVMNDLDGARRAASRHR